MVKHHLYIFDIDTGVTVHQGALLLWTLLLSHTYILFHSFSLCIYTSDHPS
jgi:hypothetical protein